MPNLSTTQAIQKNRKNAGYYCSIATQAVTGTVGILAGLLYRTPAEHCAQTQGCGKWLSDLTTQEFSSGAHFAVGLLTFGVINAYFSFDSIPRAITYIVTNESVSSKLLTHFEKPVIRQPQAQAEGKSDDSPVGDMMSFLSEYHSYDAIQQAKRQKLWQQIKIGMALTGLTATQTVQFLLISLGTVPKPSTIVTLLTVCGAVPGALYGTVGLLENVIVPHTKKLVVQLEMHYARCKDQAKYDELQYYQKRLYELQQRTKANWLKVLNSSAIHKPNFNTAQNPVRFLLEQNAPILPVSLSRRVLSALEDTTALGMTFFMSTPFVENNEDFFKNKIDIIFLRYLLAVGLSSAQIYGNVVLSHHIVSSFTNGVTDFLTGKGVNSLFYQMRPLIAGLTFLFQVLLASLSYALVFDVAEVEYDDFAFKTAFMYTGMISIVLYHLGGLMEFDNLLYARFANRDKEKFLLEVQQVLELFQNLNVKEFAHLIEIDNSFSDAVGTSPHSNRTLVDDDTPFIIPDLTDSFAEEEKTEPEKTSSYWCCFNNKDKTVRRGHQDLEAELSNSRNWTAEAEIKTTHRN